MTMAKTKKCEPNGMHSTSECRVCNNWKVIGDKMLKYVAFKIQALVIGVWSFKISFFNNRICSLKTNIDFLTNNVNSNLQTSIRTSVRLSKIGTFFNVCSIKSKHILMTTHVHVNGTVSEYVELIRCMRSEMLVCWTEGNCIGQHINQWNFQCSIFCIMQWQYRFIYLPDFPFSL